MKRITMTLMIALFFGTQTIKAQDQELSTSEPISSGCLSRNYEEEASDLPTIKLTKEGSMLSVQLLNYISNCGTTDFQVKSRISGSNEETPSVFISVVPVIPAEKDCYCPFNISYTVRDLEPNRFYLNCWGYEGLVELAEGEPLVLELEEGSIAMTSYDIDSDDRISAYSSHEFFLTGRTDGMAYHSWSLLLPLANGGMQTVATSDTQSLTIPAITNEKQYAINASGEIVGEILYNGTVRGTNISISHTVRLQLKPRIISVEVVEQKRNELDAGYFDLTFDIKYEGCSYIYATIEEVENNMMFDNFSYVPDSTRLEFKKIDPSVELWLTVEARNDYGKDTYSMEIEGLKNIDIAYRPFVEDGKVWVLRCNPALGISDASWIEYYYFDGDSIIDGHRCKIMKSVSNVNEDNWVNGVFTPDGLPQYYVGAFYEQDRKVYYKQYQQPFEQIYDFTLSSNDIFTAWGYPVAVQKISGVIPGFKGTYYEFWLDNQILGRWFEGIGCNTSLPYISHPWNYYGGGSGMLLSCFVGDEVIYLNNEYEDGVIPIDARKGRFDFTHTIKTQPRAPRKREVNSSSLYGEYNEQKLTIHLDPLYDTYLVRITDETGKAVYEKTVNTSTIVGLNIDISAYAAGRYAVTVENSRESFSGEFRILTTEIKEVRNGNKEAIGVIYNLQGQRLSGKPAKGVYIENGKKRLVK